MCPKRAKSFTLSKSGLSRKALMDIKLLKQANKQISIPDPWHYLIPCLPIHPNHPLLVYPSLHIRPMHPSPACPFLPIPMSILITHYHLDYLYLSLPNLSHFLALLHSVYPPCPALPMLIPFLADPSPTDCSPCLYPPLHIPTTTYIFFCIVQDQMLFGLDPFLHYLSLHLPYLLLPYPSPILSLLSITTPTVYKLPLSIHILCFAASVSPYPSICLSAYPYFPCSTVLTETVPAQRKGRESERESTVLGITYGGPDSLSK